MKTLLKKIERPLKQGAIILLGAAALTGVLLNLDFNLLEANLYDVRVAHGLQSPPSKDIVLVTLDDASAKALDEFIPFPLDLHAKFLERIEKYQPRAVGYLVDLFQVNQSNPDLLKTEWPSRFVDAAKQLEKRGTSVLLGTPYDVTGEVTPPAPLNEVPHAIALIHKDGNVFAEDKVTRRALTYLNNRPVFHTEFAQRLGLIGAGFRPNGSFHVDEVDGDYFFFRYHGNTVRSPYKTVSFNDILNGSVSEETLRHKILLVGTLSKDDSGDFAITPYSKSPFATPKLVVHANILESLILNDGLNRAPAWANVVVTFAVTAFVLWWVLSTSPLLGVFATLGLIGAILVLGQVLYQFYGIWLRESQPLVGIFVGYYLSVPYRLIREYKKRWDYQKKNEILAQVDEMKTNFTYLITHDLKTPVARIQGLTEVLMRKAADRLVDRDKETLESIIYSTDELNRFINSILELGKIESKMLTLNFESKDVNQLVERSIEGFKAQAKVRKIKIQAELEPLFPIKLDAGLISKVLNNLIDNAIKYSPEGSELLIQSREEDEMVEISVRDQGIGLTPEERESLFTRFYRAKNDTTTRVTGTGLGLYLTKYFIEAHDGRVVVESEKGKGSTFKIFLPVHSGAGLARASQTDSKLKENVHA